HAHAAGWVHRDVKPSNLLLNSQGIVKILDLGLARLLEEEEEDQAGLTRAAKGILGTLDYLAPEQSLDSHNVDARADIYSLGATFYHLLTGRPPFPRGSANVKVTWHRQVRPRPIHNFREDVPAGLCAVLERMMAKDREQRYQELTEVIEALAPWADGPAPL